MSERRLLLVALAASEHVTQSARALLGLSLELAQDAGGFVFGLLRELLPAGDLAGELVDGRVYLLLGLLARTAELTLALDILLTVLAQLF